MSLKYGLLGLINNDNVTGYDICKTFNCSLNYFWNASTSQIYREISKLVDEGLVNEKIVIQHDKPNKKELYITEQGKESLNNWLKECDDVNSITEVRNPILLKIYFLHNISIDEAINYVEKCKQTLQKFNDSIELSQKSIDSTKNEKHKLYYQFTKNFGIVQSKALIEWANDTINQLKQEKKKEET